MENQKPIKVSDWSQPFKIALMVIFLIGAALFAVEILSVLREIAENTAR